MSWTPTGNLYESHDSDLNAMEGESYQASSSKDYTNRPEAKTARREISDDDVEAFLKSIDTVYRKKREIDSDAVKTLIPRIDRARKIITLPDTMFDKPDNLIVKAMAVMARKQGLVVEVLNYGERAIRELIPKHQQMSFGIAYIVESDNDNIVIRNKQSNFEEGRTFARAQQILHIFGQDKLSPAVLRKNNKFFANNPSEIIKVERSTIPVFPLKKEMHELFIEQDWEDSLSSLLINLLKHSADTLSDSRRRKLIEDNIIGFGDIVSTYGTRSILVQEARGKKQAIYERKVPHLPKASPLLLPSESDFIESLARKIFINVDATNPTEWVDHVLIHGIDKVISRVKTSMQKRAEFLTRFGKLTTNRLNEIRKIVDLDKLKKKEVTSDKVTALVKSRSDPSTKFAEEVSVLDPRFDSCLAGFVNKNIQRKGEIDMILTLKSISNAVDDFGVYDDIKRKQKKAEFILSQSDIKEDKTDHKMNRVISIGKSGDLDKSSNPVIKEKQRLDNLKSSVTEEILSSFDNKSKTLVHKLLQPYLNEKLIGEYTKAVSNGEAAKFYENIISKIRRQMSSGTQK